MGGAVFEKEARTNLGHMYIS